jgi:hypothetical protein
MNFQYQVWISRINLVLGLVHRFGNEAYTMHLVFSERGGLQACTLQKAVIFILGSNYGRASGTCSTNVSEIVQRPIWGLDASAFHMG